jgi:hypothetical protein
MAKNRTSGWKRLIDGYPWFVGSDAYPLPAYSEFMPAPRVGYSLYGELDETLFAHEDEHGWQVPEIEEDYELRVGLEHIAQQVVGHLVQLGRGQPASHVAGHKGRNLENNPYWPPELAAHIGHLPDERYVTLLPLALSKTQDYLGHVRWTVFGASEQGPERAFWQSFYSSPHKELPVRDSRAFIGHLLSSAYGETAGTVEQLRRLGFRILPSQPNARFPHWTVERLPKWTHPFVIEHDSASEHIRFLLTFRPFSELPPDVQKKYLAGELALLPSPLSLVFWGMPPYLRYQEQLPLGLQTALLPLLARHEGPGIRIPQSGWLREPRRDGTTAEIDEALLLNMYTRTHRWNRVRRDEDAVAQSTHISTVTDALFSATLDDIGLYGKPMARNSQIWTEDAELLLDGPNATRAEIDRAAAMILEGGLFHYRFQVPAMRVGLHEVYWQRPLVAYWSRPHEQVKMLDVTLPGYLTAYRYTRPDLTHPVELFPRLRREAAYLDALRTIDESHDHYRHQTPLNILTILDMSARWPAQRLPHTFARQMLRVSQEESFEAWLQALGDRATEPAAAHRLTAEITRRVMPASEASALPAPITYSGTATRAYEEAYWNDLLMLSKGQFLNKVNSDVVQDEHTLRRLRHPHRDLHMLGEYLLGRHREAITAEGMAGVAFAGELPFKWETDFEFPLFMGWRHNQDGKEFERNILVVIPGKNRGEAVVMGDHYDTAYMEDFYYHERGGDGARIAAPGADDNASATATLLQAAPIYLRLAREGKLERDVWLIHLTGEEFPSDCMGARVFCQALVEQTLKLQLSQDQSLDLSGTRVVGVLVMDMIAHNRDHAKNIFQISPGKSTPSLHVAWQAHLANLIWNDRSAEWNQWPDRRGRGHGQRSADDTTIPEVARHPQLDGEVRTWDDPQSSVFNTDVQIFSDIGAPAILMMEDYDINRVGYHDSKDTLANIDLDYGAALSAISIETIARLATLKEPNA